MDIGCIYNLHTATIICSIGPIELVINQPYWVTICVSENNYNINDDTPKLIKMPGK